MTSDDRNALAGALLMVGAGLFLIGVGIVLDPACWIFARITRARADGR